MLELELIVFGELLRAGEIDQLTFLDKLDLLAKGIAQPALDQVNAKGSFVPDGTLSFRLCQFPALKRWVISTGSWAASAR